MIQSVFQHVICRYVVVGYIRLTFMHEQYDFSLTRRGLHQNCCFFIQILLKFVLKNLTLNNTSKLFQRMSWHRPADKSISKPMLSWFVDAYVCHPE